MGGNLSSFRKRRVKKRIKEAGQMRSVIKAFEVTGKSPKASKPKAGLNNKFFGRKSTPVRKITPRRPTKDVTKVAKASKKTEPSKWKKPALFKIQESPEIPIDSLKERRRQEGDEIKMREFSATASVAHNIMYENMLEEDVRLECSYCRMVTRDVPLECRVCGRTAHRNCLGKRGYLDTENQRVAACEAENGSTVGWSCPDCEDVSQLLSPEQVQIVMERFDRYDMNQDNKFNFEDFRRRQPDPDINKGVIENEFSEYDRDKDGAVCWEEFKYIEALKLLQRASQASLVRNLKPREVERMKNLFRGEDSFNAGVITDQASQRVLQDWRGSLGFVVVPAAVQKYANFGLISWDRFIREQAFYIICARPNTVGVRPYIMSFGLP